jgi:hypothetical protein
MHFYIDLKHLLISLSIIISFNDKLHAELEKSNLYWFVSHWYVKSKYLYQMYNLVFMTFILFSINI